MNTTFASECKICGFITHGNTECESQVRMDNHMKTHETFDWKTAMNLFADGVSLQSRIMIHTLDNPRSWSDCESGNGRITFHYDLEYRRKPVPVAPKTVKVAQALVRWTDTNCWFNGGYFQSKEDAQKSFAQASIHFPFGEFIEVPE